MSTRSVQSGTYEVLYADGRTKLVTRNPSVREIQTEIGAKCLDSVNLRNGCVMMVDDEGMLDHRPVNPLATDLYHSVCRPGTIHSIHGDVVICLDEDFA